MSTSFGVTSLGGAALINELRVLAPKRFKTGAKAATRAATKEYTKGIQAAVPPPRTRGHSNLSVVAGMGDKVFETSEAEVQGKTGYGVGKKRGTYRPSGVFILTGTVNRYTGGVTSRKKIYERSGRGHQWRKRWVRTADPSKMSAKNFRGRVQKSGIVPRGVAAAGPVARQKFVDVLNRAVRRAQTRG